MEGNVEKSYSEVDVILSKLDKKYYNKISKGFLNFINTNEDKEYKTYFANKENNIKISKYTQTLLALVYRTYFCDKEQRAEYDNILNNNQIKFDEEQREKYDVEKIFQQRRTNSNISEEPVQENLQMVVVKKENIFIRFLNFLFKRKK